MKEHDRYIANSTFSSKANSVNDNIVYTSERNFDSGEFDRIVLLGLEYSKFPFTGLH